MIGAAWKTNAIKHYSPAGRPAKLRLLRGAGAHARGRISPLLGREPMKASTRAVTGIVLMCLLCLHMGKSVEEAAEYAESIRTQAKATVAAATSAQP